MVKIPEPPEQAGYRQANRPTEPQKLRAALRREKILIRQNLGPEDHARCSAMLDAHLERELAARPPGIIAFCWPVRGEFDARPLVERLLGRGWRAAMPAVTALDAPLVFRPWSPAAPMAADPYGIPIPAGTEISPMPDVILVPLVAFDARGFRLGYGGGYFDRTLAALKSRPATFGVGFEAARAETVYPLAHDIPLDAIVTEAGVARRTDAPPR